MRGAYRDGRLIDGRVPVVSSAITTVARRLEVRLSEHAAVMAKVGSATARIADKIEGANSSGAMQGPQPTVARETTRCPV
jgi:hypothetical protein